MHQNEISICHSQNDTGDQLEKMFKESQETASRAPFKMVRPYPGICIKSFTVKSKTKFFINICHTKEIPAPRDVSESELHEIIESQNASSFKVPLSVTKPRETKGKKGEPVEVSDVAVNSEFFAKKIKRGDGLFYHFLVTLIFESLEQKYQIEIDTNNFILLNRASIGELVPHQIYNRDVKTVENYHTQQSAVESNEMLGADESDQITLTPTTTKSSDRVLIEEITEKKHFKPMQLKQHPNEPDCRLVTDFDTFNRTIFIAEFHLPLVRELDELQLQANDDRLVVKSAEHGYSFDGFLPQKIDETKTRAEFDKERMVSCEKL